MYVSFSNSLKNVQIFKGIVKCETLYTFWICFDHFSMNQNVDLSPNMHFPSHTSIHAFFLLLNWNTIYTSSPPPLGTRYFFNWSDPLPIIIWLWTKVSVFAFVDVIINYKQSNCQNPREFFFKKDYKFDLDPQLTYYISFLLKKAIKKNKENIVQILFILNCTILKSLFLHQM